jgi:hypothetical protein
MLPSAGTQTRPGDLDKEIERLGSLARHMESVSGIAPGGPEAPGHDPDFPNRFLIGKIKALREREWHLAIQDAYNDLSVTWRIRAGWYTACLTTYAVAVYLFSLALMMTPPGGISLRRRRPDGGKGAGQSTTPQRPPAAVWFGGIALALTIIATLGAFYGAATSPRARSMEQAAQEAAREYADGMETLALASTPLSYAAAIQHLTHAVNARRNLVYAYSALANALFLRGSPQADERFPSMTDPSALKEARKNSEEARRRGIRRAGLYTNLGWNTFLAHLESSGPERRQLLAESIAQSGEATHRDPDDSIPFSNLGLATLMDGRTEESERHYVEAMRRSLYARADGTVRRTASDLRDRIISVLTDLELLRTYRPELGEEINTRKEWIISKAWPGQSGAYASGDARVTDVKIKVSSTSVRWDATLDRIRPKEDTVVAVWYVYRQYRPGKWVWNALPPLSGPATVDEAGELRRNKDYTSTPYRCLPPGRYRLELYVNGRRAGVAERNEADLPDLEHRELPDLSTRMCYPKDWVPSSKTLPGVVQGYVSRDQMEGAYLFRFRHPWGAARAEAAADQYVGWAFHHLGLTAPKRHGPLAGEFALDPSFVLTHSFRVSYRYAGGRALVGIGVSERGSLIIGIVHGPGDFVDTPLARYTFGSFR